MLRSPGSNNERFPIGIKQNMVQLFVWLLMHIHDKSAVLNELYSFIWMKAAFST